jgi:hypothetical protein
MDAQQISYDDMIARYVDAVVDVYSVSERVQGIQPTVFGGHSRMMIFINTLSINFVGDALRDALDPRMKL